MKIENLRSEQINRRSRVAATIGWADQQRPAPDMYFETDGAHGLARVPYRQHNSCFLPRITTHPHPSTN
jgi:hypothetical protein